MTKQIKIISGVLGGIVLLIISAGIYKFDYLSDKDGYDIDGNKMTRQIAEKINAGASMDDNKWEGEALKQKKGLSDVHRLIPPKEFKKKIESGEYVLVDIRTNEEDEEEKIPGTKIVLDFYKNTFTEKVSKLDKNKKYLYYCRTGHRSGQASELAQKFNFTEAYELAGGIVAWKEAGYKTIVSQRQ